MLTAKEAVDKQTQEGDKQTPAEKPVSAHACALSVVSPGMRVHRVSPQVFTIRFPPPSTLHPSPLCNFHRHLCHVGSACHGASAKGDGVGGGFLAHAEGEAGGQADPRACERTHACGAVSSFTSRLKRWLSVLLHPALYTFMLALSHILICTAPSRSCRRWRRRATSKSCSSLRTFLKY